MCEIRENAMQKKQFQQNMKDKVRVFEDGGIRLLKRGQKGVVHAIFSRFGLVLVLLLLQAFALFSLLQWFGGLLPHYFGGTLLVTAAMMVYLLNQDMDNSVRVLAGGGAGGRRADRGGDRADPLFVLAGVRQKHRAAGRKPDGARPVGDQDRLRV